MVFVRYVVGLDVDTSEPSWHENPRFGLQTRWWLCSGGFACDDTPLDAGPAARP